MKAIEARRGAAEPVLVWTEASGPGSPGPEEVIIGVRAAGVNRADLLQARGLYPPPAGESPVMGLEVAGTILDVGSGASPWQPGQQVIGLVPGGGYAERCAVHRDLLLPLPGNWSFVEGAAVPEAWLTAFSNLDWEGGLRPGDNVLVHAGASGVGTAAIQIAKSAGAWVLATAGSDPKCDACRRFGADRAVNYRNGDLADALADVAFDVVLDCVGGPYWETHLDRLRPGGRLMLIGLLGGRTAKTDLAAVLMKSLRIQGTRLRARPLGEKAAIRKAFEEKTWPLLTSGRLTPVVDSTFPIRRASDAHRYLAENRNIGKVVLTIDP